VYVPEKLPKELAAYVSSRPKASQELPLFYTQKRSGFDANTLEGGRADRLVKRG
jgi:integrase/recombinase XerD